MLLHLPDDKFLGREAVCPQCAERFTIATDHQEGLKSNVPKGSATSTKKKKETANPPTEPSKPEVVDTISMGNPLASSKVGPDEPSSEAPPAVFDTISSKFDSKRLAHFVLLDEIGQGSFGTVYRAQDTMLNRTVAIKIPKTGTLGSQDSKEFVREAQMAAKLRHPNILMIYQVGVDSGVPYIVTDLIEGTDLSVVLENGNLSPQIAAKLCRKLASALQAAHKVGVIHRDLKPANILMEDGLEPKIADFGLAKSLHAETNSTGNSDLKGTPAYMSPEQVTGQHKTIDGRSDIFALGIILYEMLTGERPFKGNTWTVIQNIVTKPPKPIQEVNAAVPGELVHICMRCLEKEPENRYPNAFALYQDLTQFLNAKKATFPPARPINPAPLVEPMPIYDPPQPAGSTLIFKLWGAGLLLFGGMLLVVFLLTKNNDPDKKDNSKTKSEPHSNHKPESGSGTKLTGRKMLDDPEGLTYTRSILRQMKGTVDIEFIDTPLSDGMEYLADAHEITITIDQTALTEEGIAKDEPLNRTLSGISLESALDIMLTPLGLTWVPAGFGKNVSWVKPNGKMDLVITTIIESEDYYETLLYPIGDLVETQDDVNKLIASLKQDEKIFWEDVYMIGGSVEFLDAGRVLSVHQTWDGHKRTLAHLDRMRPAGGPIQGGGAGFF